MGRSTIEHPWTAAPTVGRRRKGNRWTRVAEPVAERRRTVGAVSGTHHLAQANVARLLAPLDSPQLADFVAALEPINELADRSPGFVWRLQTDDGDATSIRAFDDDLLIVNMSVWESAEALADFTYRSDHLAVMRRRREWFEPMAEAHLVLWWVPAGHVPDVDEARATPRPPAPHRPVARRLHLPRVVPGRRGPAHLDGPCARPRHPRPPDDLTVLPGGSEWVVRTLSRATSSRHTRFVIADDHDPQAHIGTGTADNRLTIAVGRALGTVVITLRGRLEGSDADFLAWMLDDLIDAQGNLSIAVDLRSLSHLDRAGADVLVGAIDAARRHGGVFGMSGLSPEVRDTIVEVGLETALAGSQG